MLQLIKHIIRISSKNDRTEINTALVDAMLDLFNPPAFAVYRCYLARDTSIAFSCAGLGPEGRFSHNAYLPERRHCRPISDDPLLLRCQTERSIVLETLPNGSDRLVFPVIEGEQLVYLIDISLPLVFPAKRRVLLMGLVEYFGHHISLLDYGEGDTLTGLANRKTFDKHLFEVLGKPANDETLQDPSVPHRRHNADDDRHWLAICDIDHFKRINDRHGHRVGDAALVMFAQLMRETFRYDDQLFRFGGEEFVIVLQPTTEKNAFSVLERFRIAVAAQTFADIGQATVSIGYCQLRPEDTPTAPIDRADAALYWVKKNGRNRVACHDALIQSGALATTGAE